jgi:hypothetical protein
MGAAVVACGAIAHATPLLIAALLSSPPASLETPGAFSRCANPLGCEPPAMHPILPTESLAGALETVCYLFTAAAAVLSCLWSLR